LKGKPTTPKRLKPSGWSSIRVLVADDSVTALRPICAFGNGTSASVSIRVDNRPFNVSKKVIAFIE